MVELCCHCDVVVYCFQKESCFLVERNKSDERWFLLWLLSVKLNISLTFCSELRDISRSHRDLQPVTEMSTRNISCGVKVAGA